MAMMPPRSNPIAPIVPFLISLLLLGAVSPGFSASPIQNASEIHSKTIYGDDNRLDLYQVRDARWLQAADSTIAMYSGDKLHKDASGDNYVLATKVFGEDQRLCKEERFWNQPISGGCSGALVGPDLVMTAGHCAACQNIKIVFGFSVYQEGVYSSTIPARDVYDCREIVGFEFGDSDPDWGLIRLDRPVAGHKPLAINRSGVLANGTPLVVIGHPSGLPTKIAGGAKVRDASPESYFASNLDAFHGNSGSPVFNQDTGLIEGILVRYLGDGNDDFALDSNRQCYAAVRCPDDGCGGIGSTKVGWRPLASLIPPMGFFKDMARIAPLNSAAFAGLLEATKAGGDAFTHLSGAKK